MLLVEYQYQNQDFYHYILIYKNSFLKKKYVNHRTGKTSFANNIFCNVCFTHFTSESSLKVHSKICNTKTRQLKLFPKEGEALCLRISNLIIRGYLRGTVILKAFYLKLKTNESATPVKKKKIVLM